MRPIFREGFTFNALARQARFADVDTDVNSARPCDIGAAATITTFVIDKSKCDGCGRCLKFCPQQCIVASGNAGGGNRERVPVGQKVGHRGCYRRPHLHQQLQQQHHVQLPHPKRALPSLWRVQHTLSVSGHQQGHHHVGKPSLPDLIGV